MKRHTLVCLAAIAAAGCASPVYVAGNVSQIDRDRAACHAAAIQAVPASSLTAIQDFEVYRDKCMLAKGYHRQ
jgi:hypothetical protein